MDAKIRSSADYRRAWWRDSGLTFTLICGILFIGGAACALLLAAAPMLEG